MLVLINFFMFLVYEDMLRSKSFEDINLIGVTMNYKVILALVFLLLYTFFCFLLNEGY